MPLLKVYYMSSSYTKSLQTTHPVSETVTGDKLAYWRTVQEIANELYDIHDKRTNHKVSIYLNIKSKANAG